MPNRAKKPGNGNLGQQLFHCFWEEAWEPRDPLWEAWKKDTKPETLGRAGPVFTLQGCLSPPATSIYSRPWWSASDQDSS
jgi:hypothetical protein